MGGEYITPGLAAVDRRWTEVTERLEDFIHSRAGWHVTTRQDVLRLLGEIDCLYTLAKYMGRADTIGMLITKNYINEEVQCKLEF